MESKLRQQILFNRIITIRQIKYNFQQSRFKFKDKNNNKSIQLPDLIGLIKDRIYYPKQKKESALSLSSQEVKQIGMFSYISTKPSQSTFQNNMIQQIQQIANQIFDSHMSSITRIQHQEMSLQLSATTSQDNLQAKCIEGQQNEEQNQLDSYTNHLRKFQNHSQRLEQFQLNNENRISQQNQNSALTVRFAKSMIMGHTSKMQSGKFSNKYMINRKSKVNVINTNRFKQSQNQKNIQERQQTVLVDSNLNKSNILMGVLNQQPKQRETTKRQRFSISYASNYLSPYSMRGIKNNPKSYMQRSHSRLKKQKQTIQLQYIKKRISENIQPQTSYRKQQLSRNRQKDKRLSQIKSKYKDYKPILFQYKQYAKQHIYKKMKTQMGVWEQKNNRYKTLSNQEIEYGWQEFIEKEQRFIQEKKQRILARQLQNIHHQNQQYSVSPTKNLNLNAKSFQLTTTPAKLTPEDFVKKYKRQKQKLKQKLAVNQVSNFIYRSFQDSKRNGSQYFDSVRGGNFAKNQLGVNLVQDFSTIKARQSLHQNQIIAKQQSSSKNDSEKEKQFIFLGIGQENQQNIIKKKSKGMKVRHQQNKLLSQSQIYINNRNAEGKCYSRQQRDKSHLSRSGQKNKTNSVLNSFVKKSSYFQSQQSSSLHPYNVNSCQHSSPVLNQNSERRNRKSKLKNKSSKDKISQLLNPKYFKSIDQLGEYASRSKERNQLEKKTFYGGNSTSRKKGTVRTQRETIGIQGDIYQNMHKRVNQHNTNGRKDVRSSFEPHLMKKTMEDLQKMRVQMQQNKKRRKHRIDSYRNFSNLRVAQDKEQKVSQRRQNPQTEYLTRYNRFRISQNLLEPTQINNGSIQRSVSVSPVCQQDSISDKSNQLSFSIINPVQQHDQNYRATQNTLFSQYSGRLSNSQMIMVKNKKQIQFILDDSLKQEQTILPTFVPINEEQFCQ